MSDPEKRKKYDVGGEKALDTGGYNSPDIFSSMFGGGQRRPRKGNDIVVALKVQLADLYNGATKSLKLDKTIQCDKCAGKGGSCIVKCSDCKGKGVKVIVRQLGPGMIQQMQAQCDRCHGTGGIIPSSNRCKRCSGNKVYNTKITLTVHINKGIFYLTFDFLLIVRSRNRNEEW